MYTIPFNLVIKVTLERELMIKRGKEILGLNLNTYKAQKYIFSLRIISRRFFGLQNKSFQFLYFVVVKKATPPYNISMLINLKASLTRKKYE